MAENDLLPLSKVSQGAHFRKFGTFQKACSQGGRLVTAKASRHAFGRDSATQEKPAGTAAYVKASRLNFCELI